MSKKLIEKALINTLSTGALNRQILQGGSEDIITIPASTFIPNCVPQVPTPNPYGAPKIIDWVKYTSSSHSTIDWAMEAKHYSPHQQANLITYLRYSIGGSVKDILKLIDCGFHRFYIIQIQTHINCFSLTKGKYSDLLDTFKIFDKYIWINKINKTEIEARKNISRINSQNRINELIKFSRSKFDQNLIYGNVPFAIIDPIANVDVTVHYLISGPFISSTLLPKLKGLNPKLPYEKQVGKKGQKPTWEIDVHIISDPEA